MPWPILKISPWRSLCKEVRPSTGRVSHLIDVCLMNCESEGCLQWLGEKERAVRGSVVMVMQTRNPKGPQDLDKTFWTALSHCLNCMSLLQMKRFLWSHLWMSLTCRLSHCGKMNVFFGLFLAVIWRSICLFFSAWTVFSADSSHSVTLTYLWWCGDVSLRCDEMLKCCRSHLTPEPDLTDTQRSWLFLQSSSALH